MYIVNLKDTANMGTESLSSYLTREMRSTYYNTKWIEGMMNHGYAGAHEFESMLADLWGLDVTTGAVTDDMWQQMYSIYIADSYDLGTKEWFNSENPWARQTMIAQMLEATRTGYWETSSDVIQNLVNEYQESVNEYGPCCCHICCANSLLDDYVQGIVTVPGITPDSDTGSSSKGTGSGTAKLVETASSVVHGSGKSAGNQTSDGEGGYGTDLSQPEPLHSMDNYVEGYEMQPVDISADQSSSAISFSGASIIATLFVLLTLGAIYVGFRRMK
jgi:cobaltochelatase CobN